MRNEPNNTFPYTKTGLNQQSKSCAHKKHKTRESALNSLFLVFYITLIITLMSLAIA
ncbi:hypothetical protein Nwat_0704 [Nitrosococcus watsonii C-113]|uniref:Uncharacterized protein n=1 Tax=Nitrosococcus watsoni (strain C-113) TaxID=105559 RepID=D8KBP9_NITWC|nr:hypothetical protein Nwat_0704 [Nitrosococcus watsonii C-113]